MYMRHLDAGLHRNGSCQDHKAARVHGTALVFVGLRYERHILVQAGVARDEAATVVLYCSLLLQAKEASVVIVDRHLVGLRDRCKEVFLARDFWAGSRSCGMVCSRAFCCISLVVCYCKSCIAGLYASFQPVRTSVGDTHRGLCPPSNLSHRGDVLLLHVVEDTEFSENVMMYCPVKHWSCHTQVDAIPCSRSMRIMYTPAYVRWCRCRLLKPLAAHPSCRPAKLQNAAHHLWLRG